MQPGFLHGDVLIRIHRARVCYVTQRADLASGDHVFVVGASGTGAGGLTGGVLHQLADLFLEGHGAEKSVYPGIEAGVRDARIGMRAGSAGLRVQQRERQDGTDGQR